jgi:hypothetical protein
MIEIKPSKTADTRTCDVSEEGVKMDNKLNGFVLRLLFYGSLLAFVLANVRRASELRAGIERDEERYSQGIYDRDLCSRTLGTYYDGTVTWKISKLLGGDSVFVSSCTILDAESFGPE